MKGARMTFLAENGFACCEKLTVHPEFERWKDMMSPGEFKEVRERLVPVLSGHSPHP